MLTNGDGLRTAASGKRRSRYKHRRRVRGQHLERLGPLSASHAWQTKTRTLCLRSDLRKKKWRSRLRKGESHLSLIEVCKVGGSLQEQPFKRREVLVGHFEGGKWSCVWHKNVALGQPCACRFSRYCSWRQDIHEMIQWVQISLWDWRRIWWGQVREGLPFESFTKHSSQNWRQSIPYATDTGVRHCAVGLQSSSKGYCAPSNFLKRRQWEVLFSVSGL